MDTSKLLQVYTASAGAGKTYTLSEEYIALALRNPEQSYQHILAVTFTKKATEEMKSRIMTLASANEVKILDTDPQLEDAATVVQEQMKIYVPLAGLIDYDEEIAKLTKEKERVAGEIARLQKKLSNQGFVDKAPAAVVEKEREKLAGYEGMLPELKQALSDTLAMADKNH